MINFWSKPSSSSGLGLKPGDPHYRAYVGPPEDYDLVSAMVFNLLTCLGLRQHHTVLDIGCGSLRVGRLLIPYLNSAHYIGIEPNRWLVKEGIANEIGRDLIRIKQPRFSYRESLEQFTVPLDIDFAVAQSIFSHCSKRLIQEWLQQLTVHLKDSGALLATFLVDDKDFAGDGWVYPDCVAYQPESIKQLAEANGLCFEILDWHHPRQTWAIFYKPGFDVRWIRNGISWNPNVG